MSKRLKKELGIALIILMVLLGIWMAGKQNFGNKHAARAVLTLDKTEHVIDLNQNKIYDFENHPIAIHIEVKNKKVAFVHSECRDHICESYGWLEKPGDLAVCLPAKAALSVQ